MQKLRVVIEGDYAMFTKPDLKVERVTYSVPTVSALEGILKTVHWRPSMRYVIDRIVVFNEIKYATIKVNEVKNMISLSAVEAARKTGETLSINTDSCRTQRSNLLLKDVKYGVEFHIELTGLRSERGEETVEKHENQFLRHMRQGRRHSTGYLGCRDYLIKRMYVVDDFNYAEVSPTLKGYTAIGRMLYRTHFVDNGVPINNDWITRLFSDEVEPIYYVPVMVDGVIEVPRIELVNANKIGGVV